MKKINYNKDWKFIFENDLDAYNTFGFDKYSDAAGAASRFYDYDNWQNVELPHDWAISLKKSSLANQFAGGYPNTHFHRFMTERHSEIETIYNIGWYRKNFKTMPDWKGKRIFLEFEGIFRDSIVWVNGIYLDRHTSGYTSFAIEITDHIVHGEDNSIAVRVDSEQAEGWWYEGAGIYRNVNLLIGEPLYLKYNQTVIKTQNDGTVFASAVLVNDTSEDVTKNIEWSIYNSEGKSVAALNYEVTIGAYDEKVISAELKIASPELWSVDTPYLYTLEICAGEEQTNQRFGIRTVEFDADRGFLLNGQPLKIRGACCHQDFGGVGIALSDNLQYYKIKRLKEMGVNAYRCAHHAPSPVLLDACDELGMLVMDETRMFGTAPESVRQLTDIIERDRNHPCVFIWSLGNEEFSIQDVEWSYRLMEKMTRIAKKLDNTRPVTYGGNNGKNYTGANGASEIRGINYIRNEVGGNWLDIYHCEHPEQSILGTEESSYVASRGGAVNDMGNCLLDSTGNVTMPWGSTPKGWVKFMETRDYFAGSFMWTGFDYRGEPNPFYYNNTSSSFGTIDLCGMEKPPFYYYKAWWTDEPVLKLTPHWNHKKGDKVAIAVFTNCNQITLSLNGKIIETKNVEPFDAPLFEVVFEPGILAVDGKYNDTILHDELVTSECAYEVKCVPVLTGKSEADVSIYELNAFDKNGVFCPMADNEVEIDVTNGTIAGVGNGDPANMDYEQKPLEEQIRFIEAFNCEKEVYFVPPKKDNALMYRKDWFEYETAEPYFEDDFRLVASFETDFPLDKTTEYTSIINNADGYEYVEFERLGGQVKVYLNGELIGDNIRWHGRFDRTYIRPYRFYGNFRKGENELKVIAAYSEHDFPALSGYVKIGKSLKAPWKVRLHYGKARVFVKTNDTEQLAIAVKMS